MRFFGIYLILVIILSSCQQKKDLSNQENFTEDLSSQLGNAVLWYQQSAEMEMSYLQAYDKAKYLLEKKLDTLNPQVSPAVILDLDETVLDNSPYEARLLKSGKVYGSKTWRAWCEEAAAQILPGAADFLAFADSMGIEIYYISNRKVEVLYPTIKNLQKYNLPQVDSSHVMLRKTTSDKTVRRSRVQQDHRVLLYVGDNLTDYKQLFAERNEKLGKDSVQKYKQELLHNFIMLPNPMYGEWEAAIYGNDFSLSDSVKLQKRLEALNISK